MSKTIDYFTKQALFAQEDMQPDVFKSSVTKVDPNLEADELFVLFYRKKIPAGVIRSEQKGTTVSLDSKKKHIFAALRSEGLDPQKVYEVFLKC